MSSCSALKFLFAYVIGQIISCVRFSSKSYRWQLAVTVNNDVRTSEERAWRCLIWSEHGEQAAWPFMARLLYFILCDIC
ncbi:hypothetical protein TcasGA2_TC032016 [Tribolium castaneum]|uniref:Uncharacterized protein n=1 Tax=Tribolium castaneum TaxID=7070 RepID=A0A139WNT3_TRICA|nr:hypothetical protein TcasGA2_TC032016 [Tribolium castaneum]